MKQLNQKRINKKVLYVALFITLLVGGVTFSLRTAPAADAKPPIYRQAAIASPRAMWVWDTNAPPQDIISWARTHNVNRIYMAVGWNVPEGDALIHYQTLQTLARQARITLYALGGDPSWGLPGGEQYATIWTGRMAQSGLFDGIQLDIEPYTVADQWTPEQQPATVGTYLNALTNAKASAGTLPLETVVPFWYDIIPTAYGQRSLLQEVVSRSDSIAVMAYRDSAPLVLSIINEELSAARAEHKKAYIGLETNYTGINYVDFSQENTRALETVALTVSSRLANNPAFGGIAIHDYSAWKNLRY